MLSPTANDVDLGFEQTLWVAEGANFSLGGVLLCMLSSIGGLKEVLQ